MYAFNDRQTNLHAPRRALSKISCYQISILAHGLPSNKHTLNQNAHLLSDEIPLSGFNTYTIKLKIVNKISISFWLLHRNIVAKQRVVLQYQTNPKFATMSSKTQSESSSKTPIEELEEEIIKNREANKFREATKELLVDSNQMVLTLTLNSTSNELVVTGESSIVHLIEKKGIEASTLGDIRAAMIKKNARKNNTLGFSEFYQDVSKDYSKTESAFKLLELNHVNPDDWDVLDGKKVVGWYMADIRTKNNTKYNKDVDKKATWLPEGVNKLYNSNMTRDDTTKVMKAILKTFPEVKSKQGETVSRQNHKTNNNAAIKIQNFDDTSDEAELVSDFLPSSTASLRGSQRPKSSASNKQNVHKTNISKADTTQNRKPVLGNFSENRPGQKEILSRQESIRIRNAVQKLQMIEDTSDEEESFPEFCLPSTSSLRRSQRTKSQTSKKQNALYPTLSNISDEDESDSDIDLTRFDIQENKQKANSSKKETSFLNPPNNEESRFSHSTPKKNGKSVQNNEYNLRRKEAVMTYSIPNKGTRDSKRTKEDYKDKNIGLQKKEPAKSHRASQRIRQKNVVESDEDFDDRSWPSKQNVKNATNTNVKSYGDLHKGHKYRQKKEHQSKCNNANTRTHNVSVEFYDEGRGKISDIEIDDTFELEEETRESRINKSSKRNMKNLHNAYDRRKDNDNTRNKKRESRKLNDDRETSESSSKTTNRISEKEGGGMHSDLRKKLFMGKGMQLMPREGWTRWINNLAKKPCNCCPKNKKCLNKKW